MPEKASQGKHNSGTEVTFKCKFCGEVKPLREMVILRHFYPVRVACATCNRAGISEK